MAMPEYAKGAKQATAASNKETALTKKVASTPLANAPKAAISNAAAAANSKAQSYDVAKENKNAENAAQKAIVSKQVTKQSPAPSMATSILTTARDTMIPGVPNVGLFTKALSKLGTEASAQDLTNTQAYQDAKARSRELMPASAGNLNDQILYAQNNLGRPEADQVGFMTNTSGISKGFPVNPPNPFMKQLETQAPTPTPTAQTTQQTIRNVSNVDEAQKADALKAQYETSQQARYRKALLEGDYALATALENDSKARGWALPSRQEIDTLGMQNFNATQNLIDQIPTAPTPTPTPTSTVPGEVAPKKDVEQMFKEAVVSKETPFMKEPTTTESVDQETAQSTIQDKATNLFNDQVANLKQQAEDQKKALQYKAFVDSQKLMQRIADRGLLNSGIAASMMLQKQAMDNDALSRVDANTQKLINDLAGKNLTAEAQREATATRLKSAQEINAAKLKSQEDIADAKLTASNFTDKVKSISAKIKEFGTLGYDVRGLEKLNRLYTEGQLTPKEFTAAYNKSLDDMGYTQKAALEMGQKASQAQLNLAQAGLAQAKTIGMYSDADGNLRHAVGSVVMVKGKPVKTVKQINAEEKMEIERQLLELKKKAAAVAAEQLKTASGYKFDKMALDYQKFISDVEKTGFTEAQKSERTKINRYLGDLSSLNSSGLKATDQNYIDQKDRIAKALNESFNKMDVNLTSWLNRQ